MDILGIIRGLLLIALSLWIGVATFNHWKDSYRG